ncbi:Bacteriohemerythrin [bioreactor metagenome]|jgi:hemerythrin-like metal-binding domain|uniref:Bacteriohemerythrin n=1 Tax=bioreactor metagenome TaxID=1076179 RepID=A0A644SUL5_9ZZZZ|nr:bacteriohemerythrin [Desulfovibrio desulfuricans]MEA4989825.1 bacteriohemerythrin [Desulfovibrio desulfuricans]
MGVPIIFLIIAPLAGIIAMQLTPPFSRLAVVLSLLFSLCGLVLLYRYLLLPLRTFVAAIAQPDCAEIPSIPTACDVVRALEDSLNAREAALRHDLAEARETADKLRQEIQELRERRVVDMQTQQTALAALRNAQSELNDLATAAEAGNGLPEDRSRREQILALSAALHHSESILLHASQILDAAATDKDEADTELAEAFPWDSRYNTNIPVIDGQHKLLLSYINKLHRGMQKGCDKKLLLEILDDLTGYAFSHFATEELFFSRTPYPLTARHIEVHQGFRKAVTELREAVLDDKAFIDIALLEYLKTWLVDHIQQMDVGFASYVTGTKATPKQ